MLKLRIVNAELQTILIFEPVSGGHRANFIRWLADAVEENPPPGCRFVFVTESNVEEIFPGSKKELAGAGRWGKPWVLFRIFREACRQFAPDHILILELTHLELPLALCGSLVPLSAVLFIQYPELPHGLKLFYKHWKTKLLLWRAPVKNLFLLNGEKSCDWLCERFGSRCRFLPLADPASEVLAEEGFSLRQHYRIKPHCTVFLFFGAISCRKGADILLNALSLIPPDAAEQSAFVFCGEAEPACRREFELAVADLCEYHPHINLHVDEQFVSDGRMMALFDQSDVILMPYTRPEYSSGILSLAARARKPVIGPDAGLLGRLISENGLGEICPVRAEALAEKITKAAQQIPVIDEEHCAKFVRKSTPDQFAETIVNVLCNES